MPRTSPSSVPVTPAVVQWAIDESGYTLENLATAIRVSPATLRAWAKGTDRPKVSELRELARRLDRPLATFLLPAPPQRSIPAVKFRSTPNAGPGRELYPIELRRLREAARLQRVLSWIHRELQVPPVALPRLRTSSDPVAAAADTRHRLKVTIEEQRGWISPHKALTAWQAAIEDSGVFVFMLSLSQDACRGFSLWDEHAPLIAANTALRPEARSFTLFHEYAHLLTRTPSACLDAPSPTAGIAEGKGRRFVRRDDPAEQREEGLYHPQYLRGQRQTGLSSHVGRERNLDHRRRIHRGHGVGDLPVDRHVRRTMGAYLLMSIGSSRQPLIGGWKNVDGLSSPRGIGQSCWGFHVSRIGLP